MTLIKISTFTWEITLKRAKRVYTAIIRSTMIYELTVWHIFKKIKKSRILNKLIIIQNKCLRVITEIFKVTSIAVLETKSHVVSITNHLNQLQMNVRHRLTATNVVSLIKKTCQKIAEKLREIRNQARSATAILEVRKREWVNKLQVDFIKRISSILSSWMNIIEKQVEAQLKVSKMKKKRSDLIKRHFLKLWRIVWKHYQNSLQKTFIVAQLKVIDKNKLKLHDTLIKTESALTTQIRFEKIDLTNFLFRRKIFDIIFSICLCEWSRQISQHVIMNCDLQNYRSRLTMLKEVDTLTYSALIDNIRELKASTA